MKKITNEYFKLIDVLEQKVLENNIIEILNIFDEIKLFWNKHKSYLMNEINNLNEKPAIIGCMTYPHFSEKQHFLPLAHNKMLIIDEPITKMDEIIRATYNKSKNILNVLKTTIEVFKSNKNIIVDNNIIIIPLRLYYGIETHELYDVSNKLVFSMINYMFDKDIKNDADLEELSEEYNTFKKIDELISKNNKDILFLGTDLTKLPISERIKEYYKNCGMDLDKFKTMQSPIFFIVNAIYGYSAQICDIINTCEAIKSDLYLFIEIPTFYFNILLENIYSENDDIYNKYLQTIVGYYVQQYLYYTDFNNIDLNKFCDTYKTKNLLNDIKSDYKINKCPRKQTDILQIKNFVKNRFSEFYKQTIENN